MLQVLHLDISKLNRMFAHIAMVFQLYIINVSFVLDICYKDFDLHVVVLDGVTGGYCCCSRCSRGLLRVWRVGMGCGSLLRGAAVVFCLWGVGWVRGVVPCYGHVVATAQGAVVVFCL
jgi:hypothetical protein